MSILDFMSRQQSPSLGGTGGIGALGAGNSIYPQSRMDKTQYATPMQLPTSAEVISSDYDPKIDAYTGMPSRFAKGGIAKFETGGGITDILANSGNSPESKKAVIADLYKNILGRDPNEGEDIMQWADYLDPSNPTQSVLTLADRLAQTEQGTEYGKAHPKELFAYSAKLSQSDSPFAGMDTPYSNMRYIGASNKTNYGGETTPDSTSVTHMFQDENGGIVSVDQYGQPTQYAPGRGWYDEQFKKHPDALRKYGYRNQTYLASGPLDKTYNINGVDVPITAQEYQVDPENKQLLTNKLGEYKPLELKPQDYDWFNDWGGPAMVVAIPALAAAATYAAPYLAGEAAMGAAAAEGAAEGAAAVGTAAGTAEGGAAVAEGVSQALPYTEAFDAANMAKNGYDAATIAQNLAGSGVESFIAEDLAAMAANGYTPEAMQQALQYGYSSQELAPLGLESLQAAPAGPQGTGLKEAFNIAKNANRAKTVLNMLNSAAGQGGGYGQVGQAGASAAAAPLIFNPNLNKAITPGIAPMGSQQYGQLYDTKANTYNYFDQGYAHGGIATLGAYSDGGQLLKGPGDGMSDNIPATIEEKQPARLADGEFVIPADVVSHLGNGSTDAGAKQLYKMMDKIRQARTGRKSQGKQINPNKFLLKG